MTSKNDRLIASMPIEYQEAMGELVHYISQAPMEIDQIRFWKEQKEPDDLCSDCDPVNAPKCNRCLGS